MFEKIKENVFDFHDKKLATLRSEMKTLLKQMLLNYIFYEVFHLIWLIKNKMPIEMQTAFCTTSAMRRWLKKEIVGRQLPKRVLRVPTLSTHWATLWIIYVTEIFRSASQGFASLSRRMTKMHTALVKLYDLICAEIGKLTDRHLSSSDCGSASWSHLGFLSSGNFDLDEELLLC